MSPLETSLRSRIAVLAVTTLVLNLAYSLPALAKPYKPAGAQKEPAVTGSTFVPKANPVESTGTPFAAPAPVWPGESTVDVQLPDARSRRLGLDGPQKVAGLPVRVRSASEGTLSVRSFGRAETAAAGVKGLLLRLSGAKSVDVSVDYQAFRWAYGGDWASRLRLWTVPECALTTTGSSSAGRRGSSRSTTPKPVR